ncbi:Glutathione peroxidase [Gracilaria domingensis]|nr:Glutathione peroxidase [Gracilaria domingensis]
MVGFVLFSHKTRLPKGTRTSFNPCRCRWSTGIICKARDSAAANLPSQQQQQPRISRRDFSRLLAVGILSHSFGSSLAQARAESRSAYDIVAAKDGKPFALNAYRNRLTLFVNVATYCALTPQYEGLVALHDRYQAQGFEIVASPCDQFGHQEPGSNQEICAFAKQQFGAKFLLLDKLNVNDGPQGVAPLYKFLKDTSPEGTGQRVSWNFEKFLVGTDGRVLRRYKPGILPENIEGDIKWALDHPGEALPPKKKPSLGVE